MRWMVLTVVLSSAAPAFGDYAPEDTWLTNPLGFEPLKLHTSMGFLVPAAAVGLILWLTPDDGRREWIVYDELGPSWGYKYPGTLLLENNTGFTFRLRPYLSVGADFGVYVPHDDFNATVGFAVRPFARFYFVDAEPLRVYFESGGGLIWFADEFPKPNDRDGRRGTNLNGTTRYGLGAEVTLPGDWGLLFGIRHVHVSNGNTLGVERNPSHDSNGFFAGASRRLL